MSFKLNSMYLADGYKVGHYNMYKDDLEVVYSNFTPRSNRYAPKGNNGKVLNFGQQYVVKFIVDHFNENFFNLKKEDIISNIKENLSRYLGTEYDTKHIEDLHDLGYLPLEIRGLTEGTESAIKIPILFLYNTNTKFAWVTNYIETIISNMLWQPITTATNVLLMKRIVTEAVRKTDVESMFLTDFMLHDFSMRGLTGLDAAIGSGMAFASVSKGSDSLPVVEASKYYYNETEVPIFSVKASEHSIMTAGGEEGEFEIYKELLTKFPNDIISLVSDSFDLFRVLTDYLPKLKDLIMSRNGKLVIRPDSGNPVDIICGKVNNSFSTIKEIGYFLSEVFWEKQKGKYYFTFENNIYSVEFDTLNEFALEYGTEQMFEFGTRTKIHDIVSGGSYSYINKENLSISESKGVIELLWETFGGTINDQGYKVLDSHIGMIYGEAINQDNIQEIFTRLEQKGFAATNCVFGQGSYSMQMVTRDTWGLAIKCIAQQRSGKLIQIFKDPKTDDGTKKSAKGLTVVYKNEKGEYYLKDEATLEEVLSDENELKVIFRDNQFYNQTTLIEIRERVNKNLTCN